MIRSALTACCLVVLFASAPALAQPSEAERLFEEGRQAVELGQYEVACQKFALADALGTTVGTALNLADCNEKLGRLVEAERQWTRAAELANELGDNRRAVAEERLARAREQVPHIEIRLPAETPVDARLMVNGRDADRATWERGAAVDPGTLQIDLLAPGHEPTSRSVKIAAGQRATVRLDLGAALAANETAGAGVQTIVGWTLIGVGGATLIVSAITGGVFLSRKSTIDDHCDEQDRCDAEGLDAAASAETLAIVNTVTLIGGVAAAGIGLAMVLTADDDAVELSIMPRLDGAAVSITGSF